jgi:phage-related protein
MKQDIKEIVWLGSSKKDLISMPATVQCTFGYALHLAQTGDKHNQARSLKGFSSAGILEIVEDWRGNTYRAIYTIRYNSFVYVLHCFQKKSKKDVETPKEDMDIVRKRLKIAEKIHKREGKHNEF